MKNISAEVVIVGSGIVGIATAYYLYLRHDITNILLVDEQQPMSFTSAQSGENYRNWWPHPAMARLTNRSIDLLEDIARTTDNRINMTRRGYVLCTRKSDIDTLLRQLRANAETLCDDALRIHNTPDCGTYRSDHSDDWEAAPDGVDIITDPSLIRREFPSYSKSIQNVVHIRRGGDISAQQLGVYMLETLKRAGARRVTASIVNVDKGSRFELAANNAPGTVAIQADKIVNAAGPFAGKLAHMVDVELPIFNTFQQKIAFDDQRQAIPRDIPFSIDLDEQFIDWTAEDRQLILEDKDHRWLIDKMPGAIHCRPDGGVNGTWVKLGWAYNAVKSDASRSLPMDEHFPDIVLRGAARLNPALKAYYGKLPRSTQHYGGWYTMTRENWPLIGPMQHEGMFMNCAHSGFGTMAACAAGELCAAWVAGDELPSYASYFSLQRYENVPLMKTLTESATGVL